MTPNNEYYFNSKNITKKLILDKDISVNKYVMYMLNRTQSMFKYENLPDTIPQFMLELYLQTNGNCYITKVNDNLYAFTGGLGGLPDEYYRPTIYTVANPYLKFSKNCEIGKDGILIKNDTMMEGLLPIYLKYASLLAENDITMRTASINMRLISIISAGDDRTKAAALEYLREVEKGNIGVVAEKSFMNEDTFKVSPTASGSVTNYLTQLAEYHQYLKASWFNDIGLQANYNMKRETLNSAETKMDSDVLLPLIDDMLRNRKNAIDEVNKMFGTNIIVELDSSWEDREEMLELEQEQLESEINNEDINDNNISEEDDKDERVEDSESVDS